LSECSTRLSTPGKASPALLQLNQTFISGELQVEYVDLVSTGRGVFIGVQGWVTDLVKSITCQVVAGWPSHMADRSWISASTDLQLGIRLYRLLESVIVKPTHDRLQGGADRPPPGPTSQRPLDTASSCQVHPRGDTYLGGIPNFLVIS
jgi:hypothetical protein